MKFRLIALVAFMSLCSNLAHAQDFGVAESAETIDPGNWKFKANPTLILYDDDSEPGVAFAAGYGVNETFDFEGKLALYDGLTIFGGDVEFWLVKDRALDLSLGAGYHFANSEFSDFGGFDVTVIGSHAATPKLDIYAALDMAFNKYTDDLPDASFTQIHLVPGVEYKISPDLDLVAEFGIGLNDNSEHYLTGGLAFYIR